MANPTWQRLATFCRTFHIEWAGYKLCCSDDIFASVCVCSLQFWDCLFKVTVVDCLIRLMGFTGKSFLLLTHPSQPGECFRRRAQVMS